MGCGSKAGARYRRAMWSDGTTTEIFVPIAEFMRGDVASVRMSVNVEATTGSLAMRRASRTSNDGFTWNTPAAFTTTGTISSTGWDWGTVYEPMSDDYQRFELGLLVKNSAGTTQEMGQVEVVIDTKDE